MEAKLRGWQLRLAQHFATLREHRGTNGSERPIYGLEHGLDLPEIRSLNSDLRTYITESPPSQEHSLAWIVYSSELGYQYSGDEYWQTFELKTVGWEGYENRNWIRNCYKNFQREFGGAVPTGVWANHFSIICWPITHAILPKDLQRQLARILYELRHSFSKEIFDSPSLFGELIATRSWNATSRFQSLAQETHLLGQIAAALLFQGEFGTGNLIHSTTLARIRNDLDTERRAREWLRSARESALERVNVRGLSLPNRGNYTFDLNSLDTAKEEVVALGIEPRLILQPKNSPCGSWDVLLEIPNLSHLLLRFPQTQKTLTGSRCIVAGSSGRPLARGRCLHGAQRIPLVRWPRADEVLLKFEQSDSQLDCLLRTECLLRPGRNWLFRIASDGIAYECRRLQVRPGERYIFASTDGYVETGDLNCQINFSCEGIHGAILELPKAMTLEWEELLKKLGLRQRKTVEVWPSGLTALVWDGEGYGEWLAFEQPCLAILSDYRLASLQISMDGDKNGELELTSLTPGEPIFVNLPRLQVGRHSIHVSSRSSVGETTELGDLEIVMRIREPRPWSPGMVSPLGPLMLQVDPEVPTLEQLWEGQTEISLQGPNGREIDCIVSFFKKGEKPATIAERLNRIKLPFTADEWRAHFENHFQKFDSVQKAYDGAHVCQLEFCADELGKFTIRCEREFTPLRWVLQRLGSSMVLRLFDDSGAPGHIEVSRMKFESPCAAESLEAASEYHISDSGGLYVARIQKFSVAMIVSPHVIQGFANLNTTPQIENYKRSLESVIRTVEFADLWSGANLPGDILSDMRRRKVIGSILDEICRLICGENWANAEKNFASKNSAVEILSRVVSTQPSDQNLRETLVREVEADSLATCESRIQLLTSLISKFNLLSSLSAPYSLSERGNVSGSIAPFGTDAPMWFAEFSLRLASDPTGIKTWAGEHLHFGLESLLDKPILARTARFLVKATDYNLQ